MKKLQFLFLAGALGALVACGGGAEEKKPAGADPNPELTALGKLIEANPDNDTLLFQRAELYYDLQGFDEALRDLNRALQLDSLQPAYYHLLADVLLDYAAPTIPSAPSTCSRSLPSAFRNALARCLNSANSN